MNTKQEQPEALRLADRLTNLPIDFGGDFNQAAAELRRQHEEIERLKAERDGLVVTLEKYRGQVDQFGNESASAAIAAVENKA